MLLLRIPSLCLCGDDDFSDDFFEYLLFIVGLQINL